MNSNNKPWSADFFNAQLQASIELEMLRRNSNQHAIETLVKMYTRVIDQLEEQLEYEKLKTDAYRMVWSAREYLKSLPQTQGTDIAIHQVLSRALNTLDAERVDGMAIREKYNPKVAKLKKRCACTYPNQACSECVDTKEWTKHWRPCDLVYPAPKRDTDTKVYYDQSKCNTGMTLCKDEPKDQEAAPQEPKWRPKGPRC